MSDVRSNLWTNTINATKAGLTQKYVDQATATYDPQFNTQLTSLQNALDKKVSDLEASKGGINKTYDTQVDNQNRTNTTNKNNFSNQTLARGLGRSSVATSGLGEFDQQNTRLIGNINTARAGAISDVDRNITNERSAFQNQKAQLDTDRMNKILTLARDIQEKQEAIARDEAWKKKQFDEQVRQYNLSHTYSSGGGGGGYSSGRRYYRSSGRSGGSSSSGSSSANSAIQTYANNYRAGGSSSSKSSSSGRSGGIVGFLGNVARGAASVLSPIFSTGYNIFKSIFR